MGRAGLFVVMLVACAGCGASLEAMHESNVRFEHCYGLDFAPETPAAPRLRCWRGWLDGYAAGQTRDRRDYARERVAALEAGDAAPVELAAVDPTPADRPAHRSAGEAPAARDARAATETTRQSLVVAGRLPSRAEARAASWQSCSEDCALRREQCVVTCSNCAPCEADFQACSSGCRGAP